MEAPFRSHRYRRQSDLHRSHCRMPYRHDLGRDGVRMEHLSHRTAHRSRIRWTVPVDCFRMDAKALPRAVLPSENRLQPYISGCAWIDVHPCGRDLLVVLFSAHLFPGSQRPIAHALWRRHAADLRRGPSLCIVRGNPAFQDRPLQAIALCLVHTNDRCLWTVQHHGRQYPPSRLGILPTSVRSR